MELFLLSNGKVADDAPLLSYAHSQLHPMIALREASFLHVSENRLRYYSARGEDFKVFHDGEPLAAHHDVLAIQSLVPFSCQPA